MSTLPVFDKDQRELAHKLLAIKVAYMMGRKFEEGDWGEVYCKAKGIPIEGWSNLNIDVAYENIGVEHKMLCVRSGGEITESCGRALMHPSATRSIRIASLDADANDVMKSVFQQYAELIEERREYVKNKTGTKKDVELRTGWLLWQDSLRQFLYFEEPMVAPNPNNYIAVWEEVPIKGKRKASKNLWIYEKGTDKKRFSVTTSAGIKIQPYFDVPLPIDPNLYVFTVIGETIDFGDVRIWLTESTHKEIEKVFGTLEKEPLSKEIVGVCTKLLKMGGNIKLYEQNGREVIIAAEAYAKLQETFPEAKSDEHIFLLLVNNII